MLKNHPKGLIIAAVANMGERFGFYILIAILVFFLQDRFGMNDIETGSIYSYFYFAVYALALLGGILADKYTGLGKTILVGILTMALGYGLLSVQGMDKYLAIIGLGAIALGNGLFKGNLQALLGNLYDNEAYSKYRDSAFSIFYMCINIGAFFAPSVAVKMLNWRVGDAGFTYYKDIPSLCHQFINKGGALNDQSLQRLQEVAVESNYATTNLSSFVNDYLGAVAQGYHYAFGVAAVAMLASFAVYIIFKKHLNPGDYTAKSAKEKGVILEEISPEETKQRFISLGLVFLVVIFFWMAFHQNGLTLSLFAKNYIEGSAGPLTFLFFDLKGLLSLIACLGGIVLLFNKNNIVKSVGGFLTLAGGFLVYHFLKTYPSENIVSPVLFQHFNPVFIVFLTPVVVGFFAYLGNREPSAPRKIGYGMIITAVAFTILIFCSIGLTPPKDLASQGTSFISPYWLISTYFTLTIAELCLSPMGISFVSKVAPPKFKGLMQGCWLGATALGNKLTEVGSYFWERLDVWQVWLIFVVCCLLSALIIFSLMKRLERIV